MYLEGRQNELKESWKKENPLGGSEAELWEGGKVCEKLKTIWQRKGHSFLQTAVINKCDTSHLQKSIFFLAEIENSVLPLKQWSLKSSTQQNTVIEKL